MGKINQNPRKHTTLRNEADGVSKSEVNEVRLELAGLNCNGRVARDKGKQSVKAAGSDDSDGVVADLGDSDCEWSSSDEEPATLDPINSFGKGLQAGTSYYRCNITTAVRELKAVRLRPEHYELIKTTPFYGFVRALKDIDSSLLCRVLKKHDEAIRCVMSRYNKPTGMFILGGKSLRPTKRDLELSFAIVCGRNALPLENDDAPRIKPQWVLRCFKLCQRKVNWKLSKKVMLDKLVELCGKRDPTSIADVARLIHCYLLACVFAPKKNTAISQNLASYVEDISQITSYDWAGYILKVLFNQLDETKNMKAGGCTMLLLIWLCEHVALIEPSASSRRQFPRCLKWDMRDLNLVLEKYGLSALGEGMVDTGKLELTDHEVEYFRNRFRKPQTPVSAKRSTVSKPSSSKPRRDVEVVQNSGGKNAKQAPVERRQPRNLEGLKSHSATRALKEQDHDNRKEDQNAQGGVVKAKSKCMKRTQLPRKEAGTKAAGKDPGPGVQRKNLLRLAKKRVIISDTDSSGRLKHKDEGSPSGYITPPPGIDKSRGKPDTGTPMTADFMDELDPDGVPRGGVRIAPFHVHNPPCCNLFEEDVEFSGPSRESLLEADNSRLLLALQEKEVQLSQLRTRAVKECDRHETEMIRLKGLSGKLKIAVAEVKSSYEDVISTISSECLNLAQECNRLKAIITKKTAEKTQLSAQNTQLQNEKVHLTNQILVLEDRLNEASSAGKAYVFDMEKKFDDMALRYADQKGASRTQLNEERAWSIQKDRKIDALGAALQEKELAIRNLRKELAALRLKVQDLKEVPVPDIFEHPDTVAHIECVELLFDASKVITEMGAEIEDADRTISEQAGYIERMQMVPYSPSVALAAQIPSSSSIAPDVVGTDVASSSGSVPIQRRKRNRLTVSPGSITRAIKKRTQMQRRVPRKLSNDFVVVHPMNIGDNDGEKRVLPMSVGHLPLQQHGVGAKQVVPITVVHSLTVNQRAPPVQAGANTVVAHPPFPELSSEFVAVRRTAPETLQILRDVWEETGPSGEVITTGPYGLGVVKTERCVGLLHHEAVDDCMVDGWTDTLRRLLINNPNLASVYIFPARVFGVVNTIPHPVDLAKWVDEVLATALKCDMMLFPMNAPASLDSTDASGAHWTLLRYNVNRHMWFFYNSMPLPAGEVPDVYQQQAKKIVAYVENAMKAVYKETTPGHAVLVDGAATSEPIMVDTCKQEVGSLDCGIVVCNLVELFMTKKPSLKGGIYTHHLAGAYRAKMVQWFVDPSSASC